MHRFRRTNPQNSSQIIQRAVDEKVQWMLADNVKYAQSTGLGKPPRSKGLKHLKQRRNKAMKMQDEWNRIVTENVRLLKRTREIALRTQLPPVRKQMTHKSLNEPFKQRKAKQLKEQNRLIGNRLYNTKSCIDNTEPASVKIALRSGLRLPQQVKPGKKKNAKKKQKGKNASDSPFAPGRPFAGRTILPGSMNNGRSRRP